jgi:hypothetical protein
MRLSRRSVWAPSGMLSSPGCAMRVRGASVRRNDRREDRGRRATLVMRGPLVLRALDAGPLRAAPVAAGTLRGSTSACAAAT